VNEKLIQNILIGDVWLCSGQSNMELPISRVMDIYRSEAEQYSNPMIRHIKVPLAYDFHQPLNDIRPATWQPLTPENARTFSALAYFFAKELYEKTGVPIGLLNSSVGGSPAEAWISEEGLTNFPVYLNERYIYRDDKLVESIRELDRARRHRWNIVLYQNDPGINAANPWYAINHDDTAWEKVDLLSANWANDGLNPINGSHWFRKDFTLSEEQAGKTATLRLGCIVDADSVFVNGHFVGTTAYQYPPRIYQIPAGLLKAGKNNVTVRLISYIGDPHFVEEKPYKIVFQDENQQEIILDGTWKYKQGTPMPILPGETFFQYKPTGLYNAMIYPLRNWGIKGVIWYQGESNADRYKDYYGLMESLICNWRTLWQQQELPFLIVQLASFMKDPFHPSESNWAEMREIQRQLSLKVPNTALVVTTDIGEWNDIHPLNKKDVGRRLALQARRIAYEEKGVVSDGPQLDKVTRNGNQVILLFKEGTNNLLPVEELRGFALQDANGNYEWANASINQNRVILWNEKITHPVKVRYAWGNSPIVANLKNSEGLPASPFQVTIPE
jgi:sialate O-acetylesterase